jgi:hypothetical protein
MKRKMLLTYLLIVVFCFSCTFTVYAASLTPKDLALRSVDNLDLGYNERFLEKSRGDFFYQINEFNIAGFDALEALKGTVLEGSFMLDVPDKKAVVTTRMIYNNKNYRGQFFLAEDQLFISRTFIRAMYEMFPRNSIGAPDEYPEYVHVVSEEMPLMWASLQEFKFDGISEVSRGLLRFILEAVPAECFTASLSNFTLELDHAKLEETIYLLLEKVKNEKERFAGIVVDMIFVSDVDGALAASVNPNMLKKELIEEIDLATEHDLWPTREEIGVIGDYVQMDHLKYETSILPGGKSRLETAYTLQPETGFTGRVNFNMDSTGRADNRTASYSCRFSFAELESDAELELDDDAEAANKIILNGLLRGGYTQKNGIKTQNIAFTCNMSGFYDFNIDISGRSTQQVDQDLEFRLPIITEDNSMDITELIDKGIDLGLQTNHDEDIDLQYDLD